MAAPTNAHARLDVVGATSGYGQTNIISGISFSIAPGETLAILGKNGMGKSTLLKMLMGYLKNRGGRVTLEGRDITNRAPYLNARDAISFTPQEFTIFQELSVEENLRLGVPSDRDFTERFAAVKSYFPIIGERLRQRAGTLSGGEQKMLLLTRALISRPKLMLVDEISEGLQPSVVLRVADVLRTANRELGISILLVEQNLRFALSVADRYAILKLGEIVETGEITGPDMVPSLASHLQI
jgi:ABC-type branched-subunit amino acid transport system ATPase component